MIKHKKGQTVHGWKIKQVKYLSDLKLEFVELAHIATGAKYVHIDRADSENVFCVAFKTIPEDSSGIAHILEHTVLTGSRNYPVRDPFFSMIRRSLNTFMNAFTGNDWTAYPFATENKKDFYNLMSVYLDAAFYPTLSELNFKQEGIRLELEGGELKYKGVVYNEMKGSLSSPERIMEEAITSSLFPGSNYRFNSGGDPKIIPSLTHADLKRFHARYYHPSNAFFYSYGDLPLAAHLKVLHAKVMKNFSALKIDSKVKSEPRWKKSKTAVYQYPVDSETDTSRKYHALVSWLVSPVMDAEEVLVLELLEDILLDNPASPLRRVLMESGLGSDLAEASGYNAELKDGIFSVGLKDVSKHKIAEIKKIIFSVLKKLTKTGISAEAINSSLQKLEITHNEVVNSPYPYGLKLWFRFIIPYIHGGNPLSALYFTKDIKALRKKLKQKNFLEKKIFKYFLTNKHSALLILEPDKTMQAKEEKQEKESLAKIQSRLSVEEIEQIKKDSQKLKELQETKEDLSCLPSLGRADIPLKIKKIIADKKYSNQYVISYTAKTNGIFYWSAIFPIDSLSNEELALVPLFCHVLPLLGTKQKNYLVLAEAISALTGGVSVFFQTASDRTENRSKAYIIVSAKCLNTNIKKTQSLCQEIMAEFDFSDIHNLKKFVCEYRSGLETGIVEEGHILAASLAAKNLSTVSALKEMWGGLSQYEIIKKITEKLDEKELKDLSDKLSKIGKKLFAKEKGKILNIGEEKALSLTKNEFGNFSELSSEKLDINNIIKLDKKKQKTGRYLATAVSFVSACFKVVPQNHPDSAKLSVLSKVLSRQYLHNELREKGGAYGGFSRYDKSEGIFSFGSYRDPHILNTLNVYSGAKKYVLNYAFSKKEIEEAILQVCSELDRPASEAEEARGAFYRKLYGINDKNRLDFKKQVLQVTAKDLKQAAKKYLKDNWQDYSIAVISNREKLVETNVKLGKDGLEISAV
ncbi:MAG: hypothetical protein US83_C0007G0032 [Candidatus Falkowbacteria bacterium GW2011_GWC2_38_22]|uniref:Peptidase M16C associated domain-containing protein n=1 Tax=Candidatus Falkowbacteria bacterium GW2011_GWE1_38_31 TaxID=1618638 RepID=A0A0G0K357_9BACT|nr:MAG: hypothetical protein US73_C0008G0025 [Candidatus Falkowbacteria bacterium GW2011_GWF2_38_1205]KKQ61296.1 MAG: hypothetical protein US83_C0007G0032 [Candidatus Falkowbacteria bacterium GW2011_GWC2_38_22]KKQ63132.1 MAG: hypothetical protein US84_C0008G0025 [Candidatus Falkowbacteria bacterium GW2011_GWF1_38_22]KKQ65329.1 MAG: hypothetical protein US87_C0008G0025 [Candidatus Falkowbacteria bacterium GW2011_GWE2_38_254]KKQ69905.1 MAG: hypothetical protein US91_C0008G0025 [Candidatus Falkowb